MNMKSVTKTTQSIVLEGSIPAKEVAERINKPYSTLLREINPFDTHAKLGAETLLEIMKVTRNISPLQFMARQLGYVLIPEESASATARYQFDAERMEGHPAP